MKCPHCGENVKVSVKKPFCPACGKRILVEVEKKEVAKEKQKYDLDWLKSTVRRPRILAAILVLVLVLSFGGAVWWDMDAGRKNGEDIDLGIYSIKMPGWWYSSWELVVELNPEGMIRLFNPGDHEYEVVSSRFTLYVNGYWLCNLDIHVARLGKTTTLTFKQTVKGDDIPWGINKAVASVWKRGGKLEFRITGTMTLRYSCRFLPFIEDTVSFTDSGYKSLSY